MKLNYRAMAVTAVLSVMVGAGVVGCGKKPEQAAAAQQKAPPMTVGVVEVRLGTLPIAAVASGRTVAAESSEVRPQIGGIVEEILFQEGAPVKAGQPLYRINADNYSSIAAANEAALHQAQAGIATARASVVAQQATLEQAQADLARYRELLRVDAISRQLYDQAVTNVKTARAGLEQAKANLVASEASAGSAQARLAASGLDMERTIVRAPISGKSGISAVTKGALVSAGQSTPLVIISRMDPIYVDISQSSAEILRLRESFRSGTASRGDLEVSLTLEDGSTYPIKGRLILDNGQVNQTTGAITLRAIFDNPDGGLLPGMFVNAHINQRVVEDAMLVPQASLIRTPQGQTQVYVVEDKKIVSKEVVVAGTHNGQWIVTSGLANGDKLVVMGANKVKPEQEVEVKVMPPAGEVVGAKDEGETLPPSRVGENSVLKPKNEPSKPEVMERQPAPSNESETKSEENLVKKAESVPPKNSDAPATTDTESANDLEKEMMDAADEKKAD